MEATVTEAINTLIETTFTPTPEQLARAKKAAIFERWLTEANIPFEKVVKADEWMLGKTITIEYYIAPIESYANAAQIFFTLRFPNHEASVTVRRTSEAVWGGYGKQRSTDIYTLIRWAKYARNMYGE